MGGERYPFGDAELEKLLAVYERLKTRKEGPYLVRLASECGSDPYHMTTILSRILPEGFDECIEQIFMRDGTEEGFLEEVAKSHRRGTRKAGEFLYECSPSDPVGLAYKCALSCTYLQSGESDYIPSATTNLEYFTADTDTKEEFLTWLETMPLFSASISTLFHQILFPETKMHSTALHFPRLTGKSSAFFQTATSPYLFPLACCSASLSGPWHQLFASDHDGISFNRLLNALLGYSGPTVLLISGGGGVFGAFSDSPWKEAKDFYGGSGCFLFRLLPSFEVFRAKGTRQNFVYCNPQARSKGYDNLLHGIGFGGNLSQLRLFISETFDQNIATTSDLTYDDGQLLPFNSKDSYFSSSKKLFDIDILEVYGVGGEAIVQQALEDRNQVRQIAEANIRKARKVDKAQFLDDFKSGLIESKAFQHRQQVHHHEIAVDCSEDQE